MSDAARRIETTVLVAGSGPIGCTFARELTAAGLDVVVVEAGVQVSHPPGRHLGNAFLYQRDISGMVPLVQGHLNPVSVPSSVGGGTGAVDPVSFRPERPIIRSGHNPRQDPLFNMPGAAVVYGVGGMFTHWTGGTPRLHPLLERPDFYDDVEWHNLYSRAEGLLGTRLDVFRPSIRHTVVKEALERHFDGVLPEGYGVQEMPFAGYRLSENDELVRTTGVDTILGPLLDAPSTVPGTFTLLPQHRLKRLNHQAGRVSHAVVEDLMHWSTLEVHAEVFVVASGSLLTPQVLWASGVQPPALGRFLSEHVLAFTQVVLGQDLVDGISEDARFIEKLSRMDPSDPVPIPMQDPPPMLWIPLSQERLWHCQVHRAAFQYGQLPPDVDERLVVDLRWFGMVDPVESNRISFEGSSRDKFGMPQPTFHFQLGLKDRLRSRAMMADLTEVAATLGGFLHGSEPQFMPAGSSLHFQGTHRMGTDPASSVVDTTSRVWGFENLYTGGNGNIPTRTAANPTLTSVALALHACDQIIARAR